MNHKFSSFIMAAAMLLPGTIAAESLTSASPTMSQDFNSMYDAAEATPLTALPSSSWRIDRNLTAPRTVGTWEDASSEVMYCGGISLASNASNGTWNFGASADASDRAVGGLTTTVANGTRCINLMTVLSNDDSSLNISRLNISYDIENYRYGANTAGFTVQLYTSPDGTTWTSAGDSFKTDFEPDGETIGAEVVPVLTKSVSEANLLCDVEVGATIYLAWNISVSSGTSPNKSPGLAIDNVKINAVFADPQAQVHRIYVEDATGWSNLQVSSTAFGNLSSVGSTNVNNVTYTVFEHTASAPFAITINDGGTNSLPELSVTTDSDLYLCAAADQVTVIDDPESYTGYVDPNAPVFVPSGIYLRGDVNSWGADTEWEFSDCGNGSYILYDKTLNGGFKVADASWSSTCNYGTNGSAIYPDQDYAMVAGTNDNISCGNNTYYLSEIRLTIVDGVGTLHLVSDDDATGLTSVYMVGDFNSWNYMDRSGELQLDSSDGLFHGTVSMPASSDGLSYWRIYQRPAMAGAWGAAATQTESTPNGTLVKGSTYNAAVASGTYDITFDIATGNYTMTLVSSAVSDMTLDPAETILVPTLPEKVKVLSLNNSLIFYNDQASMFNSICEGQNVDAAWTMHTMLGKPLSTHYDQGEGLADDGTPSAKMLVRSDAWSHIILQEQSSLPRTSPESFRSNIKEWVAYVREYCPNPNAIIILPLNWAFSGDWDNYTEYNNQFLNNYIDIARENGVIICPVGRAYQLIYEEEGQEACASLYSDDRHPTPKATYMAALMEYGLIYNADPTTVTWAPADITAAEAAAMRQRAASTLSAFVNPINHHTATVALKATLLDEFNLEVEPVEPLSWSVDANGTITQDGLFTSDLTRGTATITVTDGQFTRTATVTVADAITEAPSYPYIEMNNDCLSVSENFDSMGEDGLTLPEPWRIDRQTTAPRTKGTYGAASTSTMYAGGTSLASNAKNGTWNFGATGSSDRALGGITTGVDNGTRAVNVYTHLYNSGSKNIENLHLTYDVEKYRKGALAAGFSVILSYSLDGVHWKDAGDAFHTEFPADSETAGYAEVPGVTVSVDGYLPCDLERGCDLYLVWTISPTSGDAANAAQALAIDNFNLEGSLPEIPTAQHYIYAHDLTGWDYLGLYAWGDSELFGTWPGQSFVNEVTIDEVDYKVFLLDTDSGTYNLIFNNWNQGSQAPDFTITANRDYYLDVTPTAVTERDNAGVDRIEIGTNPSIEYNGNTVIAHGVSNIELYAVDGRLIASTTSNNINLQQFAPGIYIAKAGGCTLKVARN